MKYQLTLLLIIHATLAEDFTDHNSVERGFAENRYMRDINQYGDLTYDRRFKREVPYDNEYNVTQCSYDNTESTDGPYINVMGVNLNYPGVTLKAAKLVHLMVRFMPRPIFTRLASNSAVGLFSMADLPSTVFPEFIEGMPAPCGMNCRVNTLADGSQYDCSRWCTSSEYPFNTNDYPINYLWAYGNFSRTFVVETNMQCEGFNPSSGENLLIREFGLTIMTRALDEDILNHIYNAFNNSEDNNIWQGKQFKNEYDYFTTGTQAWFNGVNNRVILGGMACMSVIVPQTGRSLCEDSFQQRQYIKDNDPQLYSILNFIYNNNREYLNSDTSVCTW